MAEEPMSEFEKYELDPEDDDEQTPFSPPPEERSFGAVLLVMIILVAGGVGGYLTYRARQRPSPSPTTSVAPRVTPTPVPAPEAVGLPPLDTSDDFVREQLNGLSSHAQLRQWMGQQGLVRLFVNAVETVAKGESPRATLAFLAPKGAFATARSKGRLEIDAKSYERYDDFAEAVASIDGTAVADLFRRTLPLLEAAYRELGYPEGGFEKTLREGVSHLLRTPVIEEPIPVKEARRGNVVVFEYVDPALEGLSPAQKHLMRMGPANVRRIQGMLRGLLAGLGS